jgi:periplasmic divalent cation tolerance protein
VEDARLVLITAPDMHTAEEISRLLVGRGVLACVNLIDRVKSIYRWQGRVEEAQEVLMVGKTTRGRTAEVEEALRESHPYDVPECIFLEPAHVEAKYLSWLCDETRSSRKPGAG